MGFAWRLRMEKNRLTNMAAILSIQLPSLERVARGWGGGGGGGDDVTSIVRSAFSGA